MVQRIPNIDSNNRKGIVMKQKTWFEKILDTVKDSFEFRLETIILDITEQISKRMKERQINRTQLAKALNVSPAAVTKILKGSSNFTLRTLLSLGDVLNLDLGIEFRPKEISSQASIWVSTGIANMPGVCIGTTNTADWVEIIDAKAIEYAEIGNVWTWFGHEQDMVVTAPPTHDFPPTLASAESSAKLYHFPERKKELCAA